MQLFAVPHVIYTCVLVTLYTPSIAIAYMYIYMRVYMCIIAVYMYIYIYYTGLDNVLRAFIVYYFVC